MASGFAAAGVFAVSVDVELVRHLSRSLSSGTIDGERGITQFHLTGVFSLVP
jgi:hypothetical protein